MTGFFSLESAPDGQNPPVESVIAPVVHEAVRAYQIVTGTPKPCVHWDEAAEWERQSTRLSVRAALDGVTPAEQHQQWMEQRQAEGWRWGPVRDAENKLNPALVPYEDLSEDQRRLDVLRNMIVRSLVAPIGEDEPVREGGVDRASLRALRAAGTAGTWRAGGSPYGPRFVWAEVAGYLRGIGDGTSPVFDGGDGQQADADVQLIAAAVNNLLPLLEELEQAEWAIRVLRDDRRRAQDFRTTALREIEDPEPLRGLFNRAGFRYLAVDHSGLGLLNFPFTSDMLQGLVGHLDRAAETYRRIETGDEPTSEETALVTAYAGADRAAEMGPAQVIALAARIRLDGRP